MTCDQFPVNINTDYSLPRDTPHYKINYSTHQTVSLPYTLTVQIDCSTVNFPYVPRIRMTGQWCILLPPLFFQHRNILTFKMVLLTYDMVLDSYRGLVTKQATTNSCIHVCKSMSLVTAIYSAINKTLNNFFHHSYKNCHGNTKGYEVIHQSPAIKKSFTSGFKYFN